MRRFKALKNSGFAIASQILIVLLQFINRRFFVLFLSEEYLGANGLFSDILNMLSVAELGLGSAIVFAMYKPFADQDIPRVNALIRFYKSSYYKIGAGVTAVGLALIPFLNFFIKDPGNVEHIRLIYCLVLLNSTVTYFFSHKITILTVAQKNYIQNISNVFFKIVQLVGQMVVLYLTRNYLLYLAVQFLCTILNYVILSEIAQKQYREYFDTDSSYELTGSEKKGLFKNIKALFMHRTASFLVNGTDNIILSKFMGLATTGVFSNYTLIFNNVMNFFTIPFSAITATVGNFVASESKESARAMFWKLNFVSYWLAVVCATALMSISSPFIRLFFGEKYGMNMAVPLIMSLNFYINVMRQPVNVYKNTKGLFWQDRYKPILESAVNLAVGIFLVNRVGVISVLLGTTASALVAGLLIEIHIIYKYGFQVSAKEYYLRYVKDFLIMSLICLSSYLLCGIIKSNTFLTLIVKGIICMAVSNGVLLLIYGKTDEFRYYLNFVKEIVQRKSKN